jgi:hypothetical protein
MERQVRIGNFYCNRVYLRGLEHTSLRKRPAVFLHLRVDGDRGRQIGHVKYVLDEMERTIRGR